MRKGIIAGVMVLLLAVVGVMPTLAQVAGDIQKYPACKYCGMDRQKFAHSRVLLDYEDGTTIGTCSLHCAAMDLALNIDKTPKSIQVADYQTKDLLQAETAAWVMGGKQTGVMTSRAKWAFADRRAADAFMKENEGQVVVFNEALKASYEDMYTDTKMIREKRAQNKKMMQQEQKPQAK